MDYIENLEELMGKLVHLNAGCYIIKGLIYAIQRDMQHYHPGIYPVHVYNMSYMCHSMLITFTEN